MLAYLVMMAPRLEELRRVSKPTGSIFLHCDPTASHYLKLLMDAVFGPLSFKNEITWKRSSAHSDVKQGRKALGNVADTILYYTKSDEYVFNPQYTEYSDDYTRTTYNNVDPDGRRWKSSDITGPGGAAKGNPYFEFLGVSRYWRFTKENLDRLVSEGRIYQSRPGAVPRMKHYLDEMPGIALQNIWDDISPIGAQAAERLGYPTQKPVALLERVVRLGSNEGTWCSIHSAAVAQRSPRHRGLPELDRDRHYAPCHNLDEGTDQGHLWRLDSVQSRGRTGERAGRGGLGRIGSVPVSMVGAGSCGCASSGRQEGRGQGH